MPTPQVQRYYLQGYNITTAAYQQSLQFIYQMDNGYRLLTDIQQQLLSHNESVLQFRYQRLLEKQVLKSCTLPHGSIVNFSYENVTPPTIKMERKNALSYLAKEKPKISYGPDYAIMAYRDLNPIAGKIILRIMNRKMTQTIINCSVGGNPWCPSSSSEIKDYVLQAYPNFFMLLLVSDHNRVLYLFNRDEQTWSTNPIKYSFGTDVLIRFSETLIAATEPNTTNIKLFEHSDNQSNWKETILTVSKPITRLALHQGLVVGYDKQQLWLFYRNLQNRWQIARLADYLDTTQHTLACFDLASDIQQQSLMALNELQIFNNFISLSSLQEKNNQLYLIVHLFLLNSQYNIAQRQSFEIMRESVLSLTHDFKYDNSAL